MDYINKKQKWLFSIVALLVAAFHLIPFYILITTALKAKGDFSSKWVFPKEWSFENFSEAWEMASLGNALWNTTVITSVSALLLIIFGSLAAYPLARRRTKLNQFVFMFFIAVMVIPPLTALVPLYKLVVDIGMMNTLEIAILNNVASFLPLTIFLYSGFIRSTIPKELEEAARIDGASTSGIFFRIVFPLLKPVTASILIIACVFIWNDYQFAIFFLQAEEVKTITVALAGFFGENANRMNLVAAAAIMAVLPMVVLFLLLQKHFVKGLASGSVKG
ncbi:maltose transport protein AmyC [Niallia circulans]|jgi:raffinose/stachyose/melibiose transport system permease protein|uniref:carbohydrate ABC transporter permease n=1 Tax=Niallia TaxID=2837506 RepID=UPI00077CCA4B|nr:carbohydrate ABC transporter permease [Niallia circulans]MDR4315183.1 carbohydrate ABC transporter permease [Niallia circulans]MED3839919.1 carbohydrate ABC transporter permease [Niallia circulans]MED4241405.1 carbohydrate ABC transporter permease [Niallia circulans]MED4248066.1 carbohydrate ABC transporter permease [Niallia circulans]MED5103449.1 carbohydrate ABC transporter permease [Niallia circulans]